MEQLFEESEKVNSSRQIGKEDQNLNTTDVVMRLPFLVFGILQLVLNAAWNLEIDISPERTPGEVCYFWFDWPNRERMCEAMPHFSFFPFFSPFSCALAPKQSWGSSGSNSNVVRGSPKLGERETLFSLGEVVLREEGKTCCFFFPSVSSHSLTFPPEARTDMGSMWQNRVNKAPTFWSEYQKEFQGSWKISGRSERVKSEKMTLKVMYELLGPSLSWSFDPKQHT